MIVFLDFDGVLNAEKDLGDAFQLTYILSQEKIITLNRIPEVLPDVRFVLSTSWRKPAWSAAEDPDPRDSLREHGFIGKFHKDWRTPWHKDEIIRRENFNGRGWIRGDEIHTWLMNNNFTGSYAILDDCADFHDDQPLVQTNAWLGLMSEDIDRAIALLAGKKP